MHVRFLAPAENEMLEAAAYYEIRVKSLGENFLDIVEAAVDEIAEDPFIRSPIKDKLQQFVKIMKEG